MTLDVYQKSDEIDDQWISDGAGMIRSLVSQGLSAHAQGVAQFIEERATPPKKRDRRKISDEVRADTLRLLADGAKQLDAATKMGISVRTVEQIARTERDRRARMIQPGEVPQGRLRHSADLDQSETLLVLIMTRVGWGEAKIATRLHATRSAVRAVLTSYRGQKPCSGSRCEAIVPESVAICERCMPQFDRHFAARYRSSLSMVAHYAQARPGA